jgi:hypothetical protein
MLTLSQLAAATGFSTNEFVMGVSPSARHRTLLDSYLMNLDRGPAAVHDMMVADLRRWVDLGAMSRAADLVIVLRQFVFDHPRVASALAHVRHANACASARLDAEWRQRARTRHAHPSRVIISIAGRLRSATARRLEVCEESGPSAGS